MAGRTGRNENTGKVITIVYEEYEKKMESMYKLMDIKLEKFFME